MDAALLQDADSGEGDSSEVSDSRDLYAMELMCAGGRRCETSCVLRCCAFDIENASQVVARASPKSAAVAVAEPGAEPMDEGEEEGGDDEEQIDGVPFSYKARRNAV